MQIRVGFEMAYQCFHDTPMIVQLHVHDSRRADLVQQDDVVTDPPVPITLYRDFYDNVCGRLVAPAGRFVLSSDAIIEDSGQPDRFDPSAGQSPVQDLPESTLLFLLGSRYCETDILSNLAWQLFGSVAPGHARVQAICDYVHKHIVFNYGLARPTRTAFDAYNEGRGVCRDYAHLAVAFCRCMNIPARYCTGYITDIGVPPPYTAMDFAAWFEAYIGGEWRTFDPRNNTPRIGRILMGRGRDACDVALVTSFSGNVLDGFKVWADEVKRD